MPVLVIFNYEKNKEKICDSGAKSSSSASSLRAPFGIVVELCVPWKHFMERQNKETRKKEEECTCVCVCVCACKKKIVRDGKMKVNGNIRGRIGFETREKSRNM